MFENKIYEGIHYSRFAASWRKACEQAEVKSYFSDMVDWLKSLEINGKMMDDDTASEIANYTHNGKLELEDSAKKWLSNEEN